MDISVLLKKRGPLRMLFSKKVKELETLLKDKDNKEAAAELFSTIVDKFERITKLDDEIADAFPDGTTQDVFDKEIESVEAYRDTFWKFKLKFEKYDTCEEPAEVEPQGKSNMRFAKLTPVEYNLEPKNWMAFWGQFRPIYEDPNISCEDKHQYLLRCLNKNCKAYKLVESYPPFAQNFPVMFEHLKRRFGRDDLIVESCVRDLLSIVVDDRKLTLAELTDLLGTHIRTLNSLGMTSEKYQLFLFPLLEKCLPKNILELWLWRHEGSHEGSQSDDASVVSDQETDKVAELVAFLERHVEASEHADALKGKSHVEEARSTAASLHVSSDRGGKKEVSCLFCDLRHPSQECGKILNKSVKERRELVKQKRCCLKCLSPGHSSFNCKKYVICMICRKAHYTIVCDTESPDKVKSVKSKSEPKTSQSNFSSSKGKIYLKTLKAKIMLKGREQNVRIFLDDGSHQSYIREELARNLKIKPSDTVVLSHGLFGGGTTKDQKHNSYNVQLSDLDNKSVVDIEVLGQQTICHEICGVTDSSLIDELKMNGIQLTDTISAPSEIDILIGSDMMPALLTGKLQIMKSGVVATETKLGWCIQGTHKKKSIKNVALSLNLLNMNKMWDLDTLGINPAKEDLLDDTWEIFKESKSVNEDGRYVVALPWKAEHPPLPTHRPIAESRLAGVTTQLKKQGMFEAYDNIFQEWEKQGIIEIDPGQDATEHFVPHHPVYKPNSKTTKIRPVFAANVKTPGGASLNDCLHAGTNLIPLILPILIRFRENKFGVVSDVKRAFLEIELIEKDRNMLKFLWWRDGEKIVYRHCRNIFGVISSPFLLNACIKDLLEEYLNNEEFQNTVKILQKAIYVDNCIFSFNSEAELLMFRDKAKLLMASRQFDLRGWMSNNSSVREDDSNNEAVLGVNWELTADKLRVPLSSKINLNVSTKRELASFCNAVHDPLGMLAVVMIVPKMLLQKAWKLKYNWDAVLPEEIRFEFQKWSQSFELINECFVERCFVPDPENLNYEIHAFSDASELAYGSCIFVRQGENLRFLVAKNRLCPLDEKLTLPRKELMGCLLSARLVNTVLNALDNPDVKCYYWTDSRVALCWISKGVKWKTFVNNRVKEILSLSKVENWRFVRGIENPADELSRGLTMKEFLNEKWLDGPSWLREDPSNWQKATNIEHEVPEAYSESKTISTVNVNEPGENLSHRICEKTGNYAKILRITAYILRFGLNTRNVEKKSGPLTAEEIDKAENSLFKLVQRESLEDIENRSRSLKVIRSEDGTLRIHTKLILGNENDSFSKPILLIDSIITRRLIEYTHKLMLHASTDTVLVKLRQKVWILRGRQVVKKYLNPCVICARYNTRARVIVEAPLPADRQNLVKCFQICGVDYAGPLYLRGGEKGWIALFTCAVYRAVHLELVTSLSTEAFLQAVRRMEARRGNVSVYWCDNATNFRGASNLIDAINWEEVAAEGALQQKHFRFIPPASPWFGGWWEILVKLVKRVLKKVLSNALLNYEETVTVLCDTERVINSRPLTYVSAEAELVALTPSHFLHEPESSDAVILDTIDAMSLNGRVQYIRKLREDLKNRFKDEYLSQLVNFKVNKSKHTPDLKAGNIVLIASDNKKRLEWPMGRIVELFPGRDGEVRVAKVKTASGEFLRPLKRLHLLEVGVDFSDQNETEVPETDAVDEPSTITIGNEISKKSQDEVERDSDATTTTKAGRIIKAPKRLNLTNIS